MSRLAINTQRIVFATMRYAKMPEFGNKKIGVCCKLNKRRQTTRSTGFLKQIVVKLLRLFSFLRFFSIENRSFHCDKPRAQILTWSLRLQSNSFKFSKNTILVFLPGMVILDICSWLYSPSVRSFKMFYSRINCSLLQLQICCKTTTIAK